LVAIPGCDKNMPGCLIAMGRLNRPAIMVYGGTIRAGCTEKFPQVMVGSHEDLIQHTQHDNWISK
jgi:dihydroxy-acid dehydratase